MQNISVVIVDVNVSEITQSIDLVAINVHRWAVLKGRGHRGHPPTSQRSRPHCSPSLNDIFVEYNGTSWVKNSDRMLVYVK